MLTDPDRFKNEPHKKITPDSLRYELSTHVAEEKKISLDLIRECFGDVEEAYEDYYNWKHLENPCGKATILLAFDDKKPVGQECLIPCVLWFKNSYVNVSLSVNTCVKPEYRGNGIQKEMVRIIHNS